MQTESTGAAADSGKCNRKANESLTNISVTVKVTRQDDTSTLTSVDDSSLTTVTEKSEEEECPLAGEEKWDSEEDDWEDSVEERVEKKNTELKEERKVSADTELQDKEWKWVAEHFFGGGLCSSIH